MTISLMLAWAWAVIRLVVVPVALAWLVSRAWSAFSPAASPDIALLTLALILNQVALFLFAWRMRILLAAFGVALRWVDALRIHLQSVFYYFVVPMTVGLEIVRFTRTRATAPDAPADRIVLALVLDRVVGAVAAALTMLIALPFISFDTSIQASIPTGAAWVAFAGAAFTVALFSFHAVRRRLQEALAAISARWRTTILAIVYSIGMHTVFASGVYFAAQAFAIDVSYIEILFAVVAGLLMVAVPLSLGGIGAADVATSGVFLAIGHTLEESLVFGALPYLARLIGAVQGGIWEMAEGGADSVKRTRSLILSGSVPRDRDLSRGTES